MDQGLDPKPFGTLHMYMFCHIVFLEFRIGYMLAWTIHGPGTRSRANLELSPRWCAPLDQGLDPKPVGTLHMFTFCHIVFLECLKLNWLHVSVDHSRRLTNPIVEAGNLSLPIASAFGAFRSSFASLFSLACSLREFAAAMTIYMCMQY